MAEEDISYSQYGPPETADLMTPNTMDVQRALAANVRKNPALAMPTSGLPPARRPVPQQQPAAAAPGPQTPTSADFLRQITEKMYQRPDPAAYIEQARERGQNADRDVVLALALGNMGGEGMRPFANTLAQRGLDKGAEYEIPGGWGHVSRTGKVVWNPAKLQENELARLTKLYDISSGEETKRDLARDRAEALKEARLQRQTQQGTQQDMARFRIEDNARNHFDQVTKDTRDVLNIARTVQALPTDGRLSPVQQQSLIILLNKFQDPGSVVREGEFDRVAAAQGLLQKWGNIPQRIMSGQPLPLPLQQDIQNVIRLYTEAAENTMRGTANDYITNARQRGLDPNQIVTDRRWHPAERPGGAPAGAPGRGTRESPIKVTPSAAPAGGAPQQTIKVDY